MTTLIAFLVGYLLGTKAGEEGLIELREAVETLRNSEEVKDLVEGGLSVAKDLLRQGVDMFAQQISSHDSAGTMRRVA